MTGASTSTDLKTDDVLISELRVALGGTEILKDVSFRIRRGETLAIVGPSGSGKSTLVRALMGEISAAGEISIFGYHPVRDRRDIPGVAGYVSQDTQLYPDLTVRENIEYFGQQWGLSRSELGETVPTLLRTLGIGEKENSKVRNLSGGESRRVSIAATLVRSPALLVLDEPTTGLDPVSREHLWRFLEKTNYELDVSLLVTTHFLDEAAHADVVLILDQGKVAAYGEPQKLRNSLPGGGKAVVVAFHSLSRRARSLIRERVEQNELTVVKTVEFRGSTAKFFVEDPREATLRLVKLVDELDLPSTSVTAQECTMEDVFKFYTGKAWEETTD